MLLHSAEPRYFPEAVYRIVLVALVALGLGSSQIPRYEFAWNADACCCHHAGPCPCPGHHPGHDKTPTMRSCGSGGHEVVSPAASVVDVAPVEVAIAPAPAHVPMQPVAGPHEAPDRERPSAPS
jgi:hypothetical protein